MDLAHKIIFVGGGDLHTQNIFAADFTGFDHGFDFAFVIGMAVFRRNGCSGAAGNRGTYHIKIYRHIRRRSPVLPDKFYRNRLGGNGIDSKLLFAAGDLGADRIMGGYRFSRIAFRHYGKIVVAHLFAGFDPEACRTAQVGSSFHGFNRK